MSAVLASLLAAAPATVPPTVDNEIVVVARRLESWRGRVKPRRDGTLSCKTMTSTGDRAIDAIGCEAMITCYTPIHGELSAIAGADLSRAERRSLIEARSRSVWPCVTEARERGIAALAQRRRG